MAGTRSAPTVNGTPSYKVASVRFMDFTEDTRTVSIPLPATATNAQVEAIVAESQTLSNATIYAVEVSDVYYSTPNKGNVDTSVGAGDSNSIKDNIVVMYEDETRTVKRWYQPAPVAACFETASDKVDYLAIIDLANAVDTALAGSYTAVSVRYTERREINERSRV